MADMRVTMKDSNSDDQPSFLDFKMKRRRRTEMFLGKGSSQTGGDHQTPDESDCNSIRDAASDSGYVGTTDEDQDNVPSEVPSPASQEMNGCESSESECGRQTGRIMFPQDEVGATVRPTILKAKGLDGSSEVQNNLFSEAECVDLLATRSVSLAKMKARRNHMSNLPYSAKPNVAIKGSQYVQMPSAYSLNQHVGISPDFVGINQSIPTYGFSPLMLSSPVFYNHMIATQCFPALNFTSFHQPCTDPTKNLLTPVNHAAGQNLMKTKDMMLTTVEGQEKNSKFSPSSSENVSLTQSNGLATDDEPYDLSEKSGAQSISSASSVHSASPYNSYVRKSKEGLKDMAIHTISNRCETETIHTYFSSETQKEAYAHKLLQSSDGIKRPSLPVCLANDQTAYPYQFSVPDSDAVMPTHNKNRSSSLYTTESGSRFMNCQICMDKGSGLHYGIITCEGCKGFFKRSVQNRRIYHCVRNGNCDVSKSQRNRCQRCRFKKCLTEGMIVAAVREDRSPGGRTSGAVYDMYKVKRKTKKQQMKALQMQHQLTSWRFSTSSPVAPHVGLHMNQFQAQSNADSLIDTLPKISVEHQKDTNTHCSQMVNHQRLERSQKNENVNAWLSNNLISQLVDVDNLNDIIAIYKSQFVKSEMALKDLTKELKISFSDWLGKMTFYSDLLEPLIKQNWHNGLLLSICMMPVEKVPSARKTKERGSDFEKDPVSMVTFPKNSFNGYLKQIVDIHIYKLQQILSCAFIRTVTVSELQEEVGEMVAMVIDMLLEMQGMKISMEEYVVLKVVLFLSQENENKEQTIDQIKEQYIVHLRQVVEAQHPGEDDRFLRLMKFIPVIKKSAALLVQSKMIHVPFLC